MGKSKKPVATPVERYDTRRKVADLWVAGTHPIDIAKSLHLPLARVKAIIEYLNSRWQVEYFQRVNRVKIKALARCEMLIRKALEGWERSTQDSVKIKKIRREFGEVTETQEETRSQAGNPAFLESALNAQTMQLNIAGIRPVFEQDQIASEEYFKLDIHKTPKTVLKAIYEAMAAARAKEEPKAIEVKFETTPKPIDESDSAPGAADRDDESGA